MLTLFVLPSGSPYKNESLLLRSFSRGWVESVVRARDMSDINTKIDKISTPWYAVFYDDEFVQPQFVDAIPNFLTNTFYNVLNVYKRCKEGGRVRAFIAPRFFRNFVPLRTDSLSPRYPRTVVAETVLDGWVFSNRDMYVEGGTCVICDP